MVISDFLGLLLAVLITWAGAAMALGSTRSLHRLRRPDMGRLSMNIIFDRTNGPSPEKPVPDLAAPPFMLGRWVLAGGTAERPLPPAASPEFAARKGEAELRLRLKDATYGHGLFQMDPSLQPMMPMNMGPPRPPSAPRTVKELTPSAAALGQKLGLKNVLHPSMLNHNLAEEATEAPRVGYTVHKPFTHLPGSSMWGNRVKVWVCQVRVRPDPSGDAGEATHDGVLMCPALPDSYCTDRDAEAAVVEQALEKLGFELLPTGGTSDGEVFLPECVPLVWNNMLRSIAGAGRGDLLGFTRHPFCRIGVCVLVEHPRYGALLTRRARHMRTFPGAWVLPGGGVEGDETLQQAGLREVYEETGITVPPACLKVLGCWESSYPTCAPTLLDMGALRGHHVVVVYRALLPDLDDDEMDVLIQHEEADMAVWVTAEQTRAFLSKKKNPLATAPSSLNVAAASESAETEAETIATCSLRGIYPTSVTPSGEVAPGLGGIGEAHLFALSEWLRLKRRDETRPVEGRTKF